MIKIVCDWCGKVVREGAPGVKRVSRLICPECFETEMRRLQEPPEKQQPPGDGKPPCGTES